MCCPLKCHINSVFQPKNHGMSIMLYANIVKNTKKTVYINCTDFFQANGCVFQGSKSVHGTNLNWTRI